MKKYRLNKAKFKKFLGWCMVALMFLTLDCGIVYAILMGE